MSELPSPEDVEFIGVEGTSLIYSFASEIGQDGERIIITEHPYGKIKKEYEDGTVSIREPKGSTTTYFRDGGTVIEYIDGRPVSLPLD